VDGNFTGALKFLRIEQQVVEIVLVFVEKPRRRWALKKDQKI